MPVLVLCDVSANLNTLGLAFSLPEMSITPILEPNEFNADCRKENKCKNR